MQSGFTHRFNGEPIPPRTPYTPKQIKPCTTGKQAAKVTALAPVQTFKTVNESWDMPVAGVSIA